MPSCALLYAVDFYAAAVAVVDLDFDKGFAAAARVQRRKHDGELALLFLCELSCNAFIIEAAAI